MILLDTHTIYWFLSDNENLPEKIRIMISQAVAHHELSRRTP